MLDSQRLTRAFHYATAVTSRCQAKLSTLEHPLEVGALAAEYGGDEDQVIAALLHEVIDIGGRRHASPLNRQFGARVLRLVLDCSSLAPAEADWLSRQQRHLQHLTGVDDDALLISAGAAMPYSPSWMLRRPNCSGATAAPAAACPSVGCRRG